MGTLGCTEKKETKGQLILSIESDMALPDQIDKVRVEVLVRGSRQFYNDYSVGRDALLIPATLTLLAGDERGVPVTIRVVGFKRSIARTLRETVTTVPAGRIASLRMPVEWLCDDTATTNDSGLVSSTCGDDSTCFAGHCVPSVVEESSLPNYRAEDIFGGGATPAAGTCFDTLTCMTGGAVVQPDDQCSIEKPTTGAGINVALGVPKDGICDESKTSCFIPLDGHSSAGWHEVGGRLALPRAACERMKKGRVTAVVVSTSCQEKTESVPPCGAWSSVTTHSEASEDAAVAGATLAGTLSGGNVCCPLLADGKSFYSCRCPTGGELQLVSFDRAAGDLRTITTLSPVANKTRFSTALADGTVYWTDRETNDAGGRSSLVKSTRLSDGRTSTLTRIDADIYDESPLLTDASNLYVLANQFHGSGAGAQLLKIDRGSGDVSASPTDSNLVVLHFTQDDAAVYVVADSDAPAEAGSQFQRHSRVARFAKASGARAILAEVTVMTDDVNRGGFIGLESTGAGLLALLEDSLRSDGTADVSVVAIDSDGSVTPRSGLVSSTRPQYRMLGVVDGAALVQRSSTRSFDGGTDESTSLLVIAASGGLPRLAAEFDRDAPAFGVRAPGFDIENLYWLNVSGKLFRFPRSALH